MLPRFTSLLKDTYLLLPLIVLIVLVCSNTRTMQFSAAVAIVTAIAVGFINNLTGYYKRAAEANQSGAAGEIPKSFNLKTIFDALEAGGRSCITVTGLANRLISAIVGVSGNSMLLGLFLTMLCCIVLGMGVPTTATYCIMASTCAPILIQMGVPQIAAHFFVFYYGIVADITPPVALAAYAGAAIAKGKPMKTGVTATRLAIGAFIIPFVFAASPALLFIDTVWYEVVLITITATLGMMGVAAGLSGYLLTNMNIVERILTIGGGLALIIPGTLTDFIGLGLIALGVVMQVIRKRSMAA
ncbi:MAG: TRAP transporter large permease subunit, partial [Clostridia bacterium]|nr:TRAP transporter large permease subunit [Clostridia bacterium]